MNRGSSSMRRRSSQCAAVTRSALKRAVVNESNESLSWVVLPLAVPLQLIGIEVDVPQASGAVTLRLILEVLRLRVAALAAGRHRPGLPLVAELDHGDEAVAGVAVHLLGIRIAARAERRQRAPARRGEADRNARPLV